MPHCPAKTGSDAARPAASSAADETAWGRSVRQAGHGADGRPCSPAGGVPFGSTKASAFVERTFDLGDLLGLEVRGRLPRLVAQPGLLDGAEPKRGEGVGAVGADLLERRE